MKTSESGAGWWVLFRHNVAGLLVEQRKIASTSSSIVTIILRKLSHLDKPPALQLRWSSQPSTKLNNPSNDTRMRSFFFIAILFFQSVAEVPTTVRHAAAVTATAPEVAVSVAVTLAAAMTTLAPEDLALIVVSVPLAPVVVVAVEVSLEETTTAASVATPAVEAISPAMTSSAVANKICSAYI